MTLDPSRGGRRISFAADVNAGEPPYARAMKLKTKMWIALIGTALVLLALGGWAFDALRWPFASARMQWRLALSTR
jgi:hypothetical protein